MIHNCLRIQLCFYIKTPRVIWQIAIYCEKIHTEQRILRDKRFTPGVTIYGHARRKSIKVIILWIININDTKAVIMETYEDGAIRAPGVTVGDLSHGIT